MMRSLTMMLADLPSKVFRFSKVLRVSRLDGVASAEKVDFQTECDCLSAEHRFHT